MRPAFGPVYVATSGASQIIWQGSPIGFYWIDDRYAALSWLYFLLAALMLYAYSRPFSFTRLKGSVRRSAPPA